jgi:acetyl-CoA synthetase
MEAISGTRREKRIRKADIFRTVPVTAACAPNLPLDEQFRRDFAWADAARGLDGLPGGGLNIAYEAVDRHAAGRLKDHLAMRWMGAAGRVLDFTYGQLREQSARFAGALAALGIRRGERVFVLAGRVPELYIAALGTLKAGCVFCPLFSAFGPEPIRARVSLGDGVALVTTPALYRKKVAGIRAALPALRHVLLIDEGSPAPAMKGTQRLQPLLDAAAPEYPAANTTADDMALLHFTSGTTGKPKGAVHVHGAVLAHHTTGRMALDLHPDDVFWCTADPGWVTGTSYGIISPLTNGVTMIVDEAEFDAERWYRILSEQRVTVWYTAPTAIRMMMKAGTELARKYPLPNLRFIASVGEPLNPEAVWWGMEAFGLPIHDNWWQTETGGIMIANTAAMDIKPGSMGRPLPGIEAAIVERLDEGQRLRIVTEPGVEGELALKAGWPSMFRDYLHEGARYQKCFIDGMYLSGDLAKRDEEGYFWFVGRADDVIKSAGHLIGPFEVESVLMEHPAVAEAGVIGKPDPVALEVVKAFVTLRRGYQPSDDLMLDIQGFARKRMGAAVAPKEIAFVDTLPHTRSGKIMRRLLKAREMGLPEGDTSTLEGSS